MKTNYLTLSVFALVFAFAIPVHAAGTGICTTEYAPVCASHQVQCIKAPCYPVYQTYTNSCLMLRDDAALIHSGVCDLTESGPIKPVQAPYVPPKSCIAWFDGCNYCNKQANGGTICTMRACAEVVTEPGRCTAYATKPTPLPPKSTGGGGVVHSGTTSVSAPEATTTATTTIPVATGFWHRIWVWLTGWFK